MTNFNGYSLATYMEIGTEQGVSFSADIIKDGTKVGRVSNSGIGGPNSYRMSPKEMESFVKLAKETFDDVDFEQEDHLVAMLSDIFTATLRMKNPSVMRLPENVAEIRGRSFKTTNDVLCC
jgi:hypothetical protein